MTELRFLAPNLNVLHYITFKRFQPSSISELILWRKHRYNATTQSSAVASAHPLARSTARSHPLYRPSLSSLVIDWVNVLLPLVFTCDKDSGLLISHPQNLIADPAKSADPNAVDLSHMIHYNYSRKKKVVKSHTLASQV